MPITHVRFRLAMFGAVLGVLAVALAIRAVAPIGGRLEQSSGTALYASMIYAGALLLWPRLTPRAAGAVVLGWCWGAELFQLTGAPAALSEHSMAARLALGTSFDPVDLLWYPAGVVPLVALHWMLRKRPVKSKISY